MNSSKPYGEFYRAFQLSMPTLFAYFPLGIVFGILFTHLNYPWFLAPLMSMLVYGGSVQFVALSMVAHHQSIAAILFTTFFIASRNSFYGLTLLDRFQTHWAIKAFLIFGLVDATYAILSTNPPVEGQKDIKFCFHLTFLIYLYWVGGTFVGALFANHLPSFPGLSFVLPAFFMVLVVEYTLLTKSLTAIIFPIVAASIGYWLLPQHYLFIGICLSVIFLFSVQWYQRRKIPS